MACSKKDYVAIAALIRARLESPNAHTGTIQGLAWDMAHYFGHARAEFDKVRFLKACGIGADPLSDARLRADVAREASNV